jgi:hypothetical protein
LFWLSRRLRRRPNGQVWGEEGKGGNDLEKQRANALHSRSARCKCTHKTGKGGFRGRSAAVGGWWVETDVIRTNTTDE